MIVMLSRIFMVKFSMLISIPGRVLRRPWGRHILEIQITL